MKKILLIEDDKLLVRVYQTKLQKEGLEPIFLEDGAMAEETVRREKPVVIVLDLVMPVRNGIDTLRGLKSDAETENVPVLILTALKSEDDKKTCLELGAVEYLEKDLVSIQEVVESIKKYIGE